MTQVADQLELQRIGPQHQAGSDSLLTGAAFFKMREMFFEDNIDDVKYCGHLYGLGTSFVNGSGLTTTMTTTSITTASTTIGSETGKRASLQAVAATNASSGSDSSGDNNNGTRGPDLGDENNSTADTTTHDSVTSEKRSSSTRQAVESDGMTRTASEQQQGPSTLSWDKGLK